MPEFRKDPVTNRWVIVATDRARRPQPLEHPCLKPNSGPCPFCIGAEGETPEEIEIASFRSEGTEPNTPGWWVRVVPNKYPALIPDVEHAPRVEGLRESIPGYGFHEVIVESPHHRHTIDRLPINQVSEVLWAIRERFAHYEQVRDIRHVMLFKNHGAEAGASQEHPHCQLLAMPVVPVLIEEELAGWEHHYRGHGECIFCRMAMSETEAGERIVFQNDQFVVFCPYASRFPYECWVMPRKHGAHFGRYSAEESHELAEALQITMRKIQDGLGDPSFNLMLHSAPTRLSDDRFHWHIEIIPKLNRVAGFEWGTGCHINPVTPESAAAFLRGVERDIVPAQPLPHVWENIWRRMKSEDSQPSARADAG